MNHVNLTNLLMIGSMIGSMDFRLHLDLLMPLSLFDALLQLHFAHLKRVFVRGLDLCYQYYPCRRFHCFHYRLARA